MRTILVAKDQAAEPEVRARRTTAPSAASARRDRALAASGTRRGDGARGHGGDHPSVRTRRRAGAATRDGVFSLPEREANHEGGEAGRHACHRQGRRPLRDGESDGPATTPQAVRPQGSRLWGGRTGWSDRHGSVLVQPRPGDGVAGEALLCARRPPCLFSRAQLAAGRLCRVEQRSLGVRRYSGRARIPAAPDRLGPRAEQEDAMLESRPPPHVLMIYAPDAPYSIPRRQRLQVHRSPDAGKGWSRPRAAAGSDRARLWSRRRARRASSRPRDARPGAIPIIALTDVCRLRRSES